GRRRALNGLPCPSVTSVAPSRASTPRRNSAHVIGVMRAPLIELPSCCPSRSYDWAGPPVLRGLAPSHEPKSPEPPATIPRVAHLWRTSPCLRLLRPSPATSAFRPIIYLGMDVHTDSITIPVLPAGAKATTRPDGPPNDLPKLRKWIERVLRDGEIRACYEASGAGYVLHRAMEEWGYTCDVIAPSLIPKRSGVHRKHDKGDAADLARLHRAGELVAVRIPSEADERVRDVVRCRETFQREILKSRHYILKFL